MKYSAQTIRQTYQLSNKETNTRRKVEKNNRLSSKDSRQNLPYRMPEHQRHRDGDPHDRIQFCYQSGIKENRKRKIQNIFPTFLRIIFTWEGQKQYYRNGYCHAKRTDNKI